MLLALLHDLPVATLLNVIHDCARISLIPRLLEDSVVVCLMLIDIYVDIEVVGLIHSIGC
jgi:hypothetical protein